MAYFNTVCMVCTLVLEFWLGLQFVAKTAQVPTTIIINYPASLWVWPLLEDTLDVFSPCLSADHLWWNPSRRVLRQGETSPSERVSLPADVAGRTPCLFERCRKGDAEWWRVTIITISLLQRVAVLTSRRVLSSASSTDSRTRENIKAERCLFCNH